MINFKSILILGAAGATLSSCVVSDYPGAPLAGPGPAAFGVYDTLPDTYVGDAYFYRNRYYYGGNYQRGLYSYQGRQYNDRYYHNGQYFYGGRNESHGNRVNRAPDYRGEPGHGPDGRGQIDNHGGNVGRYYRDRR